MSSSPQAYWVILISQLREVVVEPPILKLTFWQSSPLESKITENLNSFFIQILTVWKIVVSYGPIFKLQTSVLLLSYIIDNFHEFLLHLSTDTPCFPELESRPFLTKKCETVWWRVIHLHFGDFPPVRTHFFLIFETAEYLQLQKVSMLL